MNTYSQLRAKFRGALLGVAVGDAVGAPLEGSGRPHRAPAIPVVSGGEMLWYTDDTHMTLGVAESLVACGGFDGAHLAAVLARNYASEPWRGYAAGPPAVFRLIERGVPWDQAAWQLYDGEGSYGNGAAMRVAPVALLGYHDLAVVARLAQQTALITHAHDFGVAGAVLQATAVALLLRQPTPVPLDVPAFLRTLRGRVRALLYLRKLADVEALLEEGTMDDVVARMGTGVAALESVPTALYAFLRHRDSFVDAVSYAVSLGGDTDTIGAMTGALAGAYLGEGAIPAAARERVEGGERLRQLADALLALATRRAGGRVEQFDQARS